MRAREDPPDAFRCRAVLLEAAISVAALRGVIVKWGRVNKKRCPEEE
jgi:hypothetical protein